MVVVSFPRSNAKMSCKTFWVRIEKRPYFEGYRLCGVTRRTRPQTTNQLAPRGQRVSRTFSRRVRYETPKLSAIRAIRCGDGGGAATAAPGAAVGMSPKIDIGVHAFSTLPARILFCKACGQFYPARGRGEYVGSAAALRADAAAPDRLDVPKDSLGPTRQRRMTRVYVRALDCGLCAVKNVIVNSDMTLKEMVAYTHVHDHAHAQSRTRTHAHQH